MNANKPNIEHIIPDEITRYTFSNDTGDAVLTVHRVFPGIELAYHSIHMDQLDFGTPTNCPLIEIHHCREGRIEQEFEGEFFYLMPGDLSIAVRDRAVKEYSFPLRHYHGITIAINTELAPQSFSSLLEDVSVQPLETARRLCRNRTCSIIRSQSYIEHIFAQLYAVPESIRKGYLKIKILELFQVLSGMDPGAQPTDASALSGLQVKTAKNAATYLAAHMDTRITIPELAEHFHISQTHLKQAFKGVFGVPVYSYMRVLKMQSAALKLIHTECPIMEIANECGYDNSSKFSSAFRHVMGETPRDYRKAHKKTAI